jgi:hypothetical protein
VTEVMAEILRAEFTRLARSGCVGNDKFCDDGRPRIKLVDHATSTQPAFKEQQLRSYGISHQVWRTFWLVATRFHFLKHSNILALSC